MVAPADETRHGVEPGEADPEQVLQDLSHDLMSPYCPGRTIASCPSQAARELEAEILARAEQGQSRETIETQLVERFGPEIVGYTGDPAILYGSGAIALLAALLVGWAGRRWVRRSRYPRAADGPAAAQTGEQAPQGPARTDLDRVEHALEEIDEF